MANERVKVNVRNILVGAGDLYFTDSTGTTGSVGLPEFAEGQSSLRDAFVSESNPEGAGNPWKYAGATQDGVELAYTPDYGEVEVDQIKGAAVMFNQAVTVTLGTNLAEAGLERLLLAWGLADDYLTQEGDIDMFSIGVPGDDPTERSVAVVGKGAPVQVTNPEYDADTNPDVPETLWEPRDRAYLARRVVSVEGSTVALRRTEATTFPVSFRLLPDPEFKDSEFGIIVDRIPGDATPNPTPPSDIT